LHLDIDEYELMLPICLVSAFFCFSRYRFVVVVDYVVFVNLVNCSQCSFLWLLMIVVIQCY